MRKKEKKAAAKAIKNELHSDLINQIQLVVSKFDLGSKKITKEIEKASKKLAKKLSEKIKIDEPLLTDLAANEKEYLEPIVKTPSTAPAKQNKTSKIGKQTAVETELDKKEPIQTPSQSFVNPTVNIPAKAEKKASTETESQPTETEKS